MQNMYDEKTIKLDKIGILTEIKSFLFNKEYVKTAILFGSLARGDFNYQSDIDLAILVCKTTCLSSIKNDLQKTYPTAYILENSAKHCLTVLLDNGLKIDLLIFEDIHNERFCRNYTCSEIPKSKIQESILFDKTGLISNHLSTITEHKDTKQSLGIKSLIDGFIGAFESCSHYHAKSDAYLFYFNYNIALDFLVKLEYIKNGGSNFSYCPRNFITKFVEKENHDEFHKLKANLDLTKGNIQKQKLLKYFYSIIEASDCNIEKIKTVCELIYDRDFFWNFRDVNTHCDKLISEKIFRGCSLSFYPEDKVKSILSENNIDTIIDLRAEREVKQSPYSNLIKTNIKYLNIPFDPWDQPEWFTEDKSKHIGTNAEIAYRFFIIACKKQVKHIFKEILNAKGSVFIHCHAGKDRTGIIVALLQLLALEKESNVINDYLASNMDTSIDKLEIILNEIENSNGIIPYLISCGLTERELYLLKNKICL